MHNGHFGKDTYKIVRYKFQGNNRTMERGLTLEQAQEHCQREDTHAKKDKDGHRKWFDGYTKE